MHRQLEKLHRHLMIREDTKTAIIYSLRNWLAYRFSLSGEAPYLERAYHGAMVAHRNNEPNIRLLTLAIFMAAESGHSDAAEIMLDKAWGFRKFLMQNEPFYYGALCFLRAYLAIIRQKNRAAKKYHKAFTAYTHSAVYSPHYDVMEGQLYLASRDYARAYDYLARAFAAGCRNVYIYEGLYRCYEAGQLAPGDEYEKVLEYAAARGADIRTPEVKPPEEVKPKTSKSDIALTQFELISPPDARYIFIYQPEKRGMEEYAFPAEGSLIIDSVDDFSYICLGAGKRNVISSPVRVRRVYPQVSASVYRQFYNKGDKRFQVLAYLASHYLKYPEPDAIPVFIDVLEEKILPVSYRMKVLTNLGHMYNKTKNLSDALECYAQVDLQSLDGYDLTEILNAYLQLPEYDIAAGIIEKHHEQLPAQVVFSGLSRLLAHREYPGLVQAAYNSLFFHHDENLFSFVLTHYKTSYSELVALSENLQAPDSRLDEKLLSQALWTNQVDVISQKVFRRLQSIKKAQHECSGFVELITRAVLSNNFAPEYETIQVLEDSITSDGFYLLMALCQLYLSKNITTLRSDRFIAHGISAQEERGILLPVFKENKPYPHPYLEKYQPFLFKAPPGKDIRLYYRINQETEYKSIAMEHLIYDLYTAKLPLFYNEIINFYYSEEQETGSIATKAFSYKNTTPYLNDTHSDKYFAINNAIIYEQMFRHEVAERIAEELIDGVVETSGKLI